VDFIMPKKIISSSALLLVFVIYSTNALLGQEERQQSEKKTADQTENKAEEKERFAKFEKLLTNAKLTGKFTVTGRPTDTLREETYEILSVKKLEEGDFWRFRTRIKYGDIDVVLPLPLEVKWAGDTPMISLSDLEIPMVGKGKFGARVLFHGDKYCGTWSHDDVGGHLFGTISRLEPTDKEK
jgi:hypothetical protein